LSTNYRFHEVRKGERGKVLSFAHSRGLKADAKGFQHHLSLVVEQDDALVAAALCMDLEPGQVVIEIVTGEKVVEDALITELADRCLRKVQAQDITAARLHSPIQGPTDTIWTNKNWLNQIEEASPPQLHEAGPADANQAA